MMRRPICPGCRGRFVPAVRLFAALNLGASLLLAGPSHAQQTSSVSSVFLSNGSELDFNLYGQNGGAGTNGTNSDLLAVTNQFNQTTFSSSAPPSSYIVGFSVGDSSTLTPGTLFTLATFGSTNFTAADASDFQAAPQGNVSHISGTFLLNTVNGGPGSLQFQLGSEATMPEPPSVLLVGFAVVASFLPFLRRRLAIGRFIAGLPNP